MTLESINDNEASYWGNMIFICTFPHVHSNICHFLKVGMTTKVLSTYDEKYARTYIANVPSLGRRLLVHSTFTARVTLIIS